MTKENEPSRSIRPEELVLNAFVYFNASEMDEESLVKCCLAAGCPTAEVAKQLLAIMVHTKMLSIRDDAEHGIMYSPNIITS